MKLSNRYNNEILFLKSTLSNLPDLSTYLKKEMAFSFMEYKQKADFLVILKLADQQGQTALKNVKYWSSVSFTEKGVYFY